MLNALSQKEKCHKISLGNLVDWSYKYDDWLTDFLDRHKKKSSYLYDQCVTSKNLKD